MPKPYIRSLVLTWAVGCSGCLDYRVAEDAPAKPPDMQPMAAESSNAAAAVNEPTGVRPPILVPEQHPVGEAQPVPNTDPGVGVAPNEDTPELLGARCAQHQLPPRLPVARFNGAAVTAPNGTIYLVGGATAFGTAEEDGALVLYDPGDRSYRELPSAPVGFKGIPATAFSDGKLFVLDEALWTFDPATGRWRKASPAPKVILNRAAVSWRDGRVYFFGGLSDQGVMVDRSDVYDPGTDSWSTLAPMPFAEDGIAAAISGGRIYVLGPAAAVYDPDADHWTELPASPEPRYWGSAVRVEDGRLLTMGGSRPGISGLTDVVEIFDPRDMSWSKGPALPEHVNGPAVISCSGDVLMFGGDSAGSIVDRIYGLSSQGAWTVSP